jgi:hypothetical protein
VGACVRAYGVCGVVRVALCDLRLVSDPAVSVNVVGSCGLVLCDCPQQNYQKQLGQLADMVKLVRGKLDRLARLTLGALTVIDVHARDVTKRLIQANMTSVNDFEWISQMR